MNKINKAKVGEKYLIKFVDDPFHSELPKNHWKEGIIAPSCGQDSPGVGQWTCITHNVVFGNQLQKDGHIHTGEHTLAWWCPKCCEYETP
jgi:hypothetical protein